LLYGSEYKGAGDVLKVLGWTGLFVSLGVASSKWYLMEGMTHLMFFRTFYGAVINVGLNFALIPEYGITGAAIATIISYSFAAFWFDLFSNKTRPNFYMKLNAFLFRKCHVDY
jgi:O-antigen/teichoic acid export membrane protein